MAIVFARGGSKGVPRKNLAKIGGKTLLERSLEIALKVVARENVFVSTDDAEIEAVALNAGANVLIRNSTLTADDSPEWLSWQHAVNSLRGMGREFDTLLSLPTTSPLRSVEDVQRCIEACQGDVDCALTVTRTSLSPAFNMVSMDAQKMARLLTPPENYVARRQDAPSAYAITTVAYAARADFVISNRGIWEGNVVGVEIPEERSLDIDTHWDLRVANLILSADWSGNV